MTTDDTRKLLELAAKAAGVKWPQNLTSAQIQIEGMRTWNPIESSADCGELEAKLMIDVYWLRDQVSAERFDVAERSEYYEHHNGDRQAARRMAVTKLAAKIGETQDD